MSITAAIACINAVKTTPALRASANPYVPKARSNATVLVLIPKRATSTAEPATMHAARAWNAAKWMEERVHASAMLLTSTAMAIPPTAANRHQNALVPRVKNKPAGAVRPKPAARVHARTARRRAMLPASSGDHAKEVYIPQPRHAMMQVFISEATKTAMAFPMNRKNANPTVI